MAIDRPKAIDDAPACGPQQREGRQAGEFLASRGMGAAQGKKLARRRCGIDDRGAACLRPDQAIEEAVWERRHQTATKQENWRPSFTKRNSRTRRNSPEFTAAPPRLPNQHRGRRETPRKITAIQRPRAAGAACCSQSVDHAPARRRPNVRQHPIMDQTRSRATAFMMLAHGRWKPSRRMSHTPCDALRRLAGRGLRDACRDGDVEDDRCDDREGAGCR